MAKQGTIKGQYAIGKSKIKCVLPLISFFEDNSYITYCPALDISGYGENETEADKSFELVLSEYFKYTVNKKTLVEDLRKMGWTIRKSIDKNPIPPTMSKLLETNEDFNRIFNNNEFRKTSKTINIPSFPG
jgi:hypothetical protein